MYRSSLACNFQQPQPDLNNGGGGGKSSLMSSSMSLIYMLRLTCMLLFLAAC